MTESDVSIINIRESPILVQDSEISLAEQINLPIYSIERSDNFSPSPIRRSRRVSQYYSPDFKHYKNN